MPLVDAQGAGASSAGQLLFGLTFAHHDISSVFSGTRRLDESPVSRATQSLLLETHYGVTDRLSASATFSLVRKERTTGLRSTSTPSTLATRGIGDGLVMLRYALVQPDLWSPYQLTVGGGARVPLGASSLTRDGLPLNADMQPGTGAWEGVLWSSGSVSLLRSAGLNLVGSGSYRRAGSNERFGIDDTYRFGNQLISEAGLSGGLTSRLSYTMQLRYRAAGADRRNGVSLANTGGRWLLVAPALHVSATDRVAVRVAGRYPLWQRLEGTQPTTTFYATVSLFLNFNQDDDGFKAGDPR